MTFSRRVTVTGAAVFALAGAASVLAPTAAAAPPTAAAAYNGACGSGYSVVNSAPVANEGTVFLTYSPSARANCVVTIRNNPGSSRYMSAVLSTGRGADFRTSRDEGYYTRYAGPVYLTGTSGACVSWFGEIDGQVGGKNNTNCGQN
ncbi:spore-associated protein A [Streptomyces sp. JJ66]|uniref:spore-associated protein A n=1 Tax=Streptomyces sp. JJ66 TaxID=2803843 RepID=UPI001C56515B|nr:spore-associated protein A [Streptomyces sp. JJ66]MBW1603999.1 spore-associated protein A [Streptomyces sp. JJ66]